MSMKSDLVYFFVPMRVRLKVIKIIVLQLFLCVAPLYAVNDQETFLQANQQYQEKNYEKALTLYSKIGQKGSATLYNMGNCQYQMGHEADALVCWKRAQKGAPANIKKDCAYNIDVVLNAEHKEGAIHKLLQLGSTLALQILFLFFWLSLCAAIRLSKRSKKYKVATFVLVLAIVPLAATLGVRYWQHGKSIAFVHTDAKMYAGPNERYHVIGSVAAKDELIIYTKSDNWYKVAHHKRMGWVSSDAVVVI